MKFQGITYSQNYHPTLTSKKNQFHREFPLRIQIGVQVKAEGGWGSLNEILVD